MAKKIVNGIGILETRSDGSFIYMSKRGILNIDNYEELMEVMREDNNSLTRSQTETQSILSNNNNNSLTINR